MEFHEKLQQLRKSRGLTQEELAEALYVSRTAVSKWESGRGYPSIDSLKEISKYFSVSIDDLLSGEKIITIAEKENQSNIRNMCDLLFAAVDILSLTLIFLPLYPKTVAGYVYSVNLLEYIETSSVNRFIYWILFGMLILIGITKILLNKNQKIKMNQRFTYVSIGIGVFSVLYLAMSREAYAASMALVLLVIKGMLFHQQTKFGAR